MTCRPPSTRCRARLDAVPRRERELRPGRRRRGTSHRRARRPRLVPVGVPAGRSPLEVTSPAPAAGSRDRRAPDRRRSVTDFDLARAARALPFARNSSTAPRESVLETVRHLGFLQMDPIASVATPQQLVLYQPARPVRRGELDRLLWEDASSIEYDAFIYPAEDMPLLRARIAQRRRTNKLWPRRLRSRLPEAVRAPTTTLLRELGQQRPAVSREFLQARSAAPPHRYEDHRWWGNRPTGACCSTSSPCEARSRSPAARQATAMGSRRARVPAERDAAVARGAARARTSSTAFARGLERKGRLEEPPGRLRRAGAEPRHRSLPLRPPRSRSRPGRVPVELPLPPRDVRAKAKREYGYYVLPILRGDRVVGRIDVEKDRKENALRVNGVWWEDGVRPVS